MMEKTWNDAIVRALLDAGEPLHYAEIAARISAGGYYQGSGEDPAASVRTTLSTSVRKLGRRSDFIRTGHGTYRLRYPAKMRRRLYGQAAVVRVPAAAAAHSPAPGTWDAGLVRTLEQEGRPLPLAELVQLALDRGYYRSDAEFPGRAAQAAISKSLQDHGETSPYRKLERGLYGLRVWGETPPVAPVVEAPGLAAAAAPPAPVESAEGTSLQWSGVIAQALVLAGRPLSLFELLREILDGGLYPGATAASLGSIKATISTSLRTMGETSPFVRCGRGVYGLRAQDASGSCPPAATSESSLPVRSQSWVGVSARVLREISRPMRVPEIAETALRLGYYQTDVANAAGSCCAQIATCIRQLGPDSPLVRLKRGLFWLRGVDLPEAGTVEKAEEPVAQEAGGKSAASPLFGPGLFGVRITDGEPETGTDKGTDHLKSQYFLAVAGIALGFDVMVASNDRNRVFNGQRLSDLPLCREDVLRKQFDEDMAKRIGRTDVLWLRDNMIEAAIEIECTTGVVNSLARFADILALRRNIRIPLYIAAPDARRQTVMREVNRPYLNLEGRSRELWMRTACRFLPLSTLFEFLERHAATLGCVKEDFLRRLSENCEGHPALG